MLSKGGAKELLKILQRADKLNGELDQLVDRVRAIVGESDVDGHAFDAVHGNGFGAPMLRIHTLLERLGLKVEGK